MLSRLIAVSTAASKWPVDLLLATVADSLSLACGAYLDLSDKRER